jgi:hypothetical protein
MFKRPLVPDACRRAGKVGGLAQLLQRGSPTRRDWQQVTDLTAASRWRTQPVIVKTGPKLYPRPVQRLGAEQSRPDSRYRWMRNGGHVIANSTLDSRRSTPLLRQAISYLGSYGWNYSHSSMVNHFDTLSPASDADYPPLTLSGQHPKSEPTARIRNKYSL